MRIYGAAVLAIVSLFAGVRSPAADGKANEETVAKELQAFKGIWRLSSKEEDGKNFSKEEIKDIIGTGDGLGKFSVRRGDKVIGEATVKLDPTKKPKRIDVSFTEGKHKGQTVLGIYEIASDAFRVCIAEPGGERPAEFSTRVRSGRTLVAYKREKK
jgi:uncharacterized protein (TIGR03067 family)